MAWIAKSYLIKIKEYQRGIKTDYLALCTNQESIALVLVWFLDQLTNEAKKKKKKIPVYLKQLSGPHFISSHWTIGDLEFQVRF